jgi:hypothetical protein
MNLFKYCPILYTFNFRMNWSFMSLFCVLFSEIWLWVFALIYTYLLFDISKSFILYLITFVIFLIFYEIWYICNDTWIAKKEKNPTLRIKEKLSDKFWINQIIIRILIWSLALYWMYIYNNFIWLSLLWILIMLWIIFYIHNKFRNYNINLITLFFLRMLKFSIVIVIILQIDLDMDTKKWIITWITQAFFLKVFDFLHSYYNDKMWWIEKMKNTPKYFLFILFQIILFLLNNDYIYIVTLSYFLITFINTFDKWYFTLKSNR